MICRIAALPEGASVERLPALSPPKPVCRQDEGAAA